MSAWDEREGEATPAGLRVALSLSSNRPSKGTLCSRRGARMPLHRCTPNTHPCAHARACSVVCAQCVKPVCFHTYTAQNTHTACVHARASWCTYTRAFIITLLCFEHDICTRTAHATHISMLRVAYGSVHTPGTRMCQHTRAQRHLHTCRGTHRHTAVRILDAYPQTEISLLV